MKTKKEKIIKNLIVKWELDKEMRIDELLNLCYNAGKSKTIKQIDILYNKIKGEYNEEHKIMMEVKGKDNARYYRQYAVCGQLAYGMVKLEELKETLEGELAKEQTSGEKK